MPAVDVTFTIVPLPCSRIAGRNAWIIRTAPKTFVSNIRRTSASGTVSTGPSTPNPALFTSTSTRPTSASAGRDRLVAVDVEREGPEHLQVVEHLGTPSGRDVDVVARVR